MGGADVERVRWGRGALLSALLLLVAPGADFGGTGAHAQDLPQTGAERAGWTRPTNHAEVLDFLVELEGQSDRMVVQSLGTTAEGRDLPVVFLGDVAGPREPFGERSDRPTVLILGSIHGNEPAGRDGSLQFIREVVLGADTTLLSQVHLIVVPNLNPDGGEANRRENALGYDLNRDWIVAETPEVRSVLEQLVTRFWPEVFIDVHNGGAFPYHLTYQATLDPTADGDLVGYARGPMFDAVRQHFEEQEMEAFWYSGPAFDQENDAWYWRTTEALPRKQHSYGGLQDMIALLLEIPSRHPRDVGAAAAREGLLALTRFVAGRAEEVREVVEEARRRTLAGDPTEVSLELEATPHPEPEDFFVLPGGRGGGDPIRVTGENRTLHVAVRSRPAPWGYVLGPELVEVAGLLALHEIEVDAIAEAFTVAVESYRLVRIAWSDGAYQNHFLAEVGIEIEKEVVTIPAGSLLVRRHQRGGRLIPQLLEPDAVDSVVRWNLLDDFIAGAGGAGAVLPIYRLERPIPSGVY